MFVFRKLFVALLVLFIPFSYSAQLKGKVVKVADGDTFTIFDGRAQHRVRIAEIDAPELKQRGGKSSREYLNSVIYLASVIVEYSTKDRYGRIVGEVYYNGVNVGHELVSRGHAWVYDRYVTDDYLYQLQDKAKINRLGLWSYPDPIPPWQFRRK